MGWGSPLADHPLRPLTRGWLLDQRPHRPAGGIKSYPAGAGCQDRHVSLAIIGHQGSHGMGAGVIAGRMDHFFQRIARFSFINVRCKNADES
jgi:hypothetical protein